MIFIPLEQQEQIELKRQKVLLSKEFQRWQKTIQIQLKRVNHKQINNLFK